MEWWVYAATNLPRALPVVVSLVTVLLAVERVRQLLAALAYALFFVFLGFLAPELFAVLDEAYPAQLGAVRALVRHYWRVVLRLA